MRGRSQARGKSYSPPVNGCCGFSFGLPLRSGESGGDSVGEGQGTHAGDGDSEAGLSLSLFPRFPNLEGVNFYYNVVGGWTNYLTPYPEITV